MGIFFSTLAASLISLSNLGMKKCMENRGSVVTFLLFQYIIGFAVTLLLNPIRTGNYSINLGIILFGTIIGVCLGSMVLSIGKAMEKGPPGLTFAAFNASTLFPAIFASLVFGPTLGHSYTLFHGAGSLLVIAGLAWAGLTAYQDSKQNPSSSSKLIFMPWLRMILLAFCLHIVFLFGMQWRVILIQHEILPSLIKLLPSEQAKSEWFMPFMYLGATFAVFMYSRYHKSETPFTKRQTTYATLSAIINTLGGYFLMVATEVATPTENAIIFPVFSIGVTILCNAWGRFLYREKVNWKAMNLCAFGLLVGGADWYKLFKL